MKRIVIFLLVLMLLPIGCITPQQTVEAATPAPTAVPQTPAPTPEPRRNRRKSRRTLTRASRTPIS